MIKNHKWKAIISSVVILLPVLFGVLIWEKLPASMVSHWGADGVADGIASKGLMVLCLPLILLALHWFMLLMTTLMEKNNKPQNNKIVAMSYGVIPAISLVVHTFIYSIALEKEWNLFALVPVILGALFMYIGKISYKSKKARSFFTKDLA